MPELPRAPRAPRRTQRPAKSARGHVEKAGRRRAGGTLDARGRIKENEEQLIFWNPKQGYAVAEIQMENERVREVRVETYPKWVLQPASAMSTQAKVREALGKPSRVIESDGKTHWVYTDRKASQRTLLLSFGRDGHVREMVLGPNREDWDNGRIR